MMLWWPLTCPRVIWPVTAPVTGPWVTIPDYTFVGIPAVRMLPSGPCPIIFFAAFLFAIELGLI